MNAIAQQLGEVGLPAPVAELAARHWDAVIVGGGHNGLTCAAYLARAGQSVLVLERRERLGGACTLERPFSDPAYVVSPCAYVVGLLDQLVIDELGSRRGLHFDVADPNLWVPFEDGTSFGQWLDDERTQADLKALGVCSKDIEGYWAYEHIFDEIRKRLRTGARDSWVGDSPSRAELEEMLRGEQTMIDIVFDASIAEVLDEYITDQRLKDALFGQGVIGTFAGPQRQGHRVGQAHALPGRPRGPGPGVGLRARRHGDDLLRDRRRRAGGRRGAGLRRAGGRDRARRGREARGRDAHPRRDRDLQRRPEGRAAPARRPRRPGGLPGAARGVGAAQPGRQVQRRADRLPTWTAAPGETSPRAPPSTSPPASTTPSATSSVRARRAGRRVRRDLRPDRLRPDARAAPASTS